VVFDENRLVRTAVSAHAFRYLRPLEPIEKVARLAGLEPEHEPRSENPEA
jgi:hypothetical protein